MRHTCSATTDKACVVFNQVCQRFVDLAVSDNDVEVFNTLIGCMEKIGGLIFRQKGVGAITGKLHSSLPGLGQYGAHHTNHVPGSCCSSIGQTANSFITSSP